MTLTELGLPNRGVQVYYSGGSDVSVSDGGTGASDPRTGRMNLSSAPNVAGFLVRSPNTELPNAQDLSALTSGVLSVVVADGVATLSSGTSLSGMTITGATITGSSMVVADDVFTIHDNADPTKQVQFDLSGIGGSFLQTINVPNFGGSVSHTAAFLDLGQSWGDTQDYTALGGEIFIEGDNLLIYNSALSNYAILLRGDAIADDQYFRLPNVDSNLINATFATYYPPGGVGGANLAAGDSLYGGGTTNPMAVLGIGASGTIMKSTGSAPSWVTVESVVDVARTWATLQKFKDTTVQVVDDGDATKVFQWSLGGATTGKTLTLASAHTDNRTVTLPDATCTLATPTIAQTWTVRQTFDNYSLGGGREPIFLTDPGAAASTDRNAFIVRDEANGFNLSVMLSGGMAADAVLNLPAAGGSVVTTTATQTISGKTITMGGNLSMNAKNIALDTTTGTKLGTVGGSSGQKLGFFNATPIVQPLLATGAGATVDNVITALQNLGLVRQS